MALFGSVSTVRAQLASNPAFQIALAYVEDCFRPGSSPQQRMQAQAVGTNETFQLGGGVFAMEQAYFSKARETARWESHRAYIDVQVIFAGQELIEVADIAQLKVAEDLTPAKDVLFYESFGGASVLRMEAGNVAVFFPVDAHLPSLAIGEAVLVRKTVVKVPVA